MVTSLETLLHIVHYSSHEQSGHIHHSCYTLCYILLKHLTEIITINTIHITNSVVFTLVAIHNGNYVTIYICASSVICQCHLMYAAIDLCVVLCVYCDNVRKVLYVAVCNIVYSDRVGNVYCVNCDNVSRVL